LANGLDSESLLYFACPTTLLMNSCSTPWVKNPCKSRQRTWSLELQTEGLGIAGTWNTIKFKCPINSNTCTSYETHQTKEGRIRRQRRRECDSILKLAIQAS
jgi:hypothetical protein